MTVVAVRPRMLPTETFGRAIAIEKLEERVEFSSWGGEAEASIECSSSGSSTITCEAEASVRVEWQPNMT